MAEIEGELIGFVEIWGICNKIAICIIALKGDGRLCNQSSSQSVLSVYRASVYLTVCVCLSFCLSFICNRAHRSTWYFFVCSLQNGNLQVLLSRRMRLVTRKLNKNNSFTY